MFFLTVYGGLAFAQGSGDEYTTFMKDGSVYAKLVDFMRVEKHGNTAKVTSGDITVIYVIDFLFSALCLWAAILAMTGVKVFEIKKYLWFVFSVTLCWYFMLISFKMLWGMLDFLVLKLRPELKSSLVDFFSVAMIVVAILTYIWLVARAFTLGFIGALSVTVLSHIFYFAILFLFAAIAPRNNHYCDMVRIYMGLGASVQEYLRDLYKLVSSNNLLMLVRLRFCHF